MDLLRHDGGIEQTLSALSVAALVTDAKQRIVYANPAFERITGYGLADLVGRNCRILQGPGTDAATVRAIRAALTSGRSFRGPILNYRRTGEAFWNAVAISPIRAGDGSVVGFASVQADETERIEARRRSAEQLETAELLLRVVPRLTSPDPGEVARALTDAVLEAGAPSAVLALLHGDGRMRVVASGGRAGRAPFDDRLLERVVGSRPGSRPRWIHGAAADPDAAAALGAAGVDRLVVVPVVPGATARGALLGLWGPEDGAPVPDRLVVERMGQLADLGGVAFDNLDLIHQIRSVAERDQLTGVAARFVVQHRLEDALAEQGRDVAVVFLDVDRFKRVNDSLGHAGGDALISQIAARVSAVAEGKGTVGRPGGDEFVVVLPDADETRARQVEERIAAAMRAPFRVAGRTVHASVSAGHAVGRAAQSETVEEAAARMMQAADTAMYGAKERKRARRRVETPLDLLLLEVDLREALDRGQVATHFQPQFDGRSGRLVGFEALARWRHERHGLVPPEVFIPLAEESGLIVPLGERMRTDAFSFADDAVARFGPLRLSVNLSKHELMSERFVDGVAALLGGHPDRGWALTAEVTEPELEDGDGDLRRTLERLRALDVDLAVDDFGSGFSSLKTLQDLPITSLKIDETFLRRTGALGGGMIAAIVSLGLGLGLEVMAEGVESVEQLDALRRLGCGRLQGFLLSPALRGSEALHVPTTIEDALRRSPARLRRG